MDFLFLAPEGVQRLLPNILRLCLSKGKKKHAKREKEYAVFFSRCPLVVCLQQLEKVASSLFPIRFCSAHFKRVSLLCSVSPSSAGVTLPCQTKAKMCISFKSDKLYTTIHQNFQRYLSFDMKCIFYLKSFFSVFVFCWMKCHSGRSSWSISQLLAFSSKPGIFFVCLLYVCVCLCECHDTSLSCWNSNTTEDTLKFAKRVQFNFPLFHSPGTLLAFILWTDMSPSEEVQLFIAFSLVTNQDPPFLRSHKICLDVFLFFLRKRGWF